MKNGKTCKAGVKRLHALLCGVMCLFCVLASLASCRSSRNVVEETHREVHTTVKEVNAVDTLQYTATATENRKDSAEYRTDERAVVKIKRDSVGRIVEITSSANRKVRANISGKTERDRWFYGLNATRCSEASGTSDSVEQTKKEEKKDYKFGTPLESYIGLSLVALIILFYIGDYIYRIWKRKTGK